MFLYTKNMLKINKILLSLFLVLIIVIIGEIVYLIISEQNQKNVAQTITGVQPSDQIIVKSNPQSLLAMTSQTKNILLQRISTVKKDILKKSVISFELDGKITQINNQGWKMPDGTQYQFSFQLTSPSGNSNFIMFNEDEKKIAKVVLSMDDKAIPIQLSDLKVNDYVKINQTVDLLAEDYFKGTESLTLQVTRNKTQ